MYFIYICVCVCVCIYIRCNMHYHKFLHYFNQYLIGPFCKFWHIDSQNFNIRILALCDPMDCSLPGSLFMGFSRQEYWSGGVKMVEE